MYERAQDTEGRVAIVGMAGRFPGADSVAELWSLLASGTEALSRFTHDELRATGVPEQHLADPRYVPVKGVLGDIAGFDAQLFGYSAREAAIIDPQQRIFLECAWAAMEDAGCDPQRAPGPVAVYAGAMLSTYLIRNLLPRTDLQDLYGLPMLFQGNQPDQLAARVAYKLDLRGPAVTVQTACSTSLVAVHLAVQSLLGGESDLALAGGVTVTVPHRAGYLAVEGGIESADGRCAAFGAGASGTVFGNGAGVVVLKRLRDALANGDRIHAVILGSAVNNDGANKAGYTAPGMAGQAAVVREALELAGVDPRSVGYVEAHGTGTPIGDPIEVAALRSVYGAAENGTAPWCGLGSVKSNVGHLDVAAGVAGLIKAVLALRHGRIPASLHAAAVNPGLELEGGPFFIPDRLCDWPVPNGPRRAAVSAFGIGGTNAHVVLEQTREPEPRTPSSTGAPLLLPLSAQTATALATATARLAADLVAHQDRPLADVARTLRTGRRRLSHRRAVLARTAADAAAALTGGDRHRVVDGRAAGQEPPIAFLLPGQGAQFHGMARGLYRADPVFRVALDECARLLEPHLGRDLRELLWRESADELRRTAVTQPAIFAVSYALAQLWQERGIVPTALLGHSLGEYTAACLSGVFALPDALALVARRGRLIEETGPGAMLAVPLDERAAIEAAEELGLDLAAVNAPGATVLSGPCVAIDKAEDVLRARAVRTHRLPVNHAFHSRLCTPAAESLAKLLDRVPMATPRLPFLANLTGDWITAEQATDPNYWLRQMCEPVRFHAALRRLASADERTLLLETGPGSVLTDLARANRDCGLRAAVPPLPTRGRADDEHGSEGVLRTIGSLWTLGADVELAGSADTGAVTTLPGYPFERRRHWIEPAAAVHPRSVAPPADVASTGRASTDVLHGRVVWRPVADSTEPAGQDPFAGRRSTWLVLMDADRRAQPLVDLIVARGQILTCVTPGTEYRRVKRGLYELNPDDPEHYTRLLRDLRALVRTPTAVLHCWGLGGGRGEDGYWGLVRLARAFSAERVVNDVRIGVLTAGAFAAAPGDVPDPEAALLSGPVLVLPEESRNLSCLHLDLAPDAAGRSVTDQEARVLVRALHRNQPVGASLLALRDGRTLRRRVERHSPWPAGDAAADRMPRLLRRGGTYLITGGLGGLGRTFAGHLARTCAARLVLVGRAPDADLPELAELWAQGAEVMVERADVTDREALGRALDRVRQRFGRVDGVIHAAGVAGGGSVERRTDEQMRAVLAPKTAGVRQLLAALRPDEADFVLFCSSLAALVPTYGQADYAAANAYLAATAAAENARGTRFTLAVDWDMWSRVGMAANTDVPADLREFQRATLAGALTPEQGAQALIDVLAGEPGQVVVARGTAELTPDGRLQLPQLTGPAGARAAEERQPRPELSTPYTAPRTETEQRLAELYCELLGMDQVGVLDDFLELGGHSLLAAQLAARLRAEFDVEIQVRTFFEGGRVADLATAVEECILADLENSEESHG